MKITIQKRSYEPLNLFLCDKPRLPAEREHNKTVSQRAEAIRAKQLLEIESSRHGLDDRTKLSASFFDYFDQLTDEKASGSKSNHLIWISTRHHLHRYHGLSELTFEQVDKRFLEGFRHYLQHEATTKSGTKLAKNTTSSYFNKVRAALNQAYRDGIVRDNPVQQVKSIKPENTKRTYLTLEEVRALTKAECWYDVLRRAFLFSCTMVRYPHELRDMDDRVVDSGILSTLKAVLPGLGYELIKDAAEDIVIEGDL